MEPSEHYEPTSVVTNIGRTSLSSMLTYSESEIVFNIFIFGFVVQETSTGIPQR